MQLFRDPEHMIETKMIVHGYLGYKASKEMEQFFTHGELKRIAHYEDGIWIALTHSRYNQKLFTRCISRKTLHCSSEFTSCVVDSIIYT